MNPDYKKYILENIGKKSIQNIAGDLHITEKAVRRFLEKEQPKTIKTEFPKGQTNPAKNMPSIIYILVIIAVGLIAYVSYLPNDFVWDDQLLVQHNSLIKNISNIKYIFGKPISTEGFQGYYRPIQVLSYTIEYSLWAAKPFGYHLTSLLIQMLNAIVVFYLCTLIMGDRWKSLFVAAVFCVHPAFVPIVGYISGRSDLLGLLFSLLTIYLVIGYIMRAHGRSSLWLGALCYVLAVFSKEFYLITPLLIIAYVFIYKGKAIVDKNVIILLIFMAATVGFYALFRLKILNIYEVKLTQDVTPFWLERIAVFPYVLTHYVTALATALNLGMEKRLFYSSLIEPRFVLSYLTLFIILGLLGYFYKKNERAKVFWLAWFLIALLPVSHIFYPLFHLWAEHWSYMAAIGFFGFLASISDVPNKWVKKPSFLKWMKISFSIIIVSGFTILTINESKYWKNNKEFYSWLLQKSPYSDRAAFNLGMIYEKEDDYKKALELYGRAIADPLGDKAKYRYVRGLLYKKTGDPIKARDDFEAAVKLDPSDSMYHNNLGAIYGELGMIDKARAEWREALKLDPKNQSAQRNLKRSGEE